MSKLRSLAVGAILVAAVVLAAGWFLLVSPQRSKAAELQGQAESVRASTSSLQTQLSLLKSQAKGLPAQRAALQSIAVKVPSNPAEPALVRSLTAAADAAGVDLTTIAPGTPMIAPAAPGAPAAAGVTGVQVATIALRITAVGTYYELEQFQSNLESLSRALKTTAINLVPGGDKPKAVVSGAAPVPGTVDGYSGTLTASISANVYMTVERPAAPLTGAGATAPGPTK